LQGHFKAHSTHEQSVIAPPSGSKVLAASKRDSHQVLRHGKQAVGTQFHPKFSAEIMRAYIRHKHSNLLREGTDPHQIFNSVAATPEARRLLSRFAHQHGWTGAREGNEPP
jgi:GMP synthase (glutamine-hydrolysing)